MVSGPINCVKYLVFIFNLIFFLFGVTLIAIGAYVQYQLSDYLNLFNTDINGPAILLIVVGLIIFVIAFFGCCGAIKENYCMVLTFSILMMIILVCQIGGAIAGFVYSNSLGDIVKEQLMTSMSGYTDPEKGGVKDSWDWMQDNLQCCGTHGRADWKSIGGKKFEKGPPGSCCNTTDITCGSYSVAHNDGCVNRVERLIEKNVYYVGAVGISLAVIQVMGIVLSCCLARAVRKEYEV